MGRDLAQMQLLLIGPDHRRILNELANPNSTALGVELTLKEPEHN